VSHTDQEAAELTLTAPELREALRQTRETLREVLEEWRVSADPEYWHAPAFITLEQMRDWRRVAGLPAETETE
jgi:predicted butyrate kinase (DUF1464 family)